LGATASDNINGDITASIDIDSSGVNVSAQGSYSVIYTVSDAAGNSASVNRIVTITPDVTNPVITLTGGSQSIELGSAYSELGATASDNINGDITASIDIDSSEVNVSAKGNYTVSYTVSDAAGNTAIARRVVTINADEASAAAISEVSQAAANSDGSGVSINDLNAIAGLNNQNAANLEAYQAAIAAANNAAASDLGDVANIQALINEVNLLSAIGAAADNADITATFTEAQLNSLSLVGVTSANAIAYNTYIDANADFFSTPVTSVELQSMVHIVNVIEASKLAADPSALTDTLLQNAGVKVNSDFTSALTNAERIAIAVAIVSATPEPGTTAELQALTQTAVTPLLTLIGNTIMSIEQGTSYNDPGATASDLYDSLASPGVVVGGDSVNTNSVGTYTVTYNVSDEAGNAAIAVIRTVNVVDTTAPVIIVVGGGAITHEQGTVYTDTGVTATDALSAIPVVTSGSVNTAAAGDYVLTYTATDSSANSTTVTRTVTVADSIGPVITLIGDTIMVMEVGNIFADAGAMATDTVDGDLTSTILVTGVVDTSAVGAYTLRYTVSDMSNNEAIAVTRTVIVEAAPVSIDLVIPDDLSVNATGFLTGVNLDPGGAASAISSEGNILDVVPDQAGPFYSGSYEILWSATTAGITVSATQSLKVVPVVNLATAITVTEGNNLGLAVMLSGQAADYPVIVPFTVGGTAVEGDDYSVDPSGSIIITEGTMGTIRLNILEDAVAESQETVIITLGDVTNAALGVSVEQVINIVEVNLPPKVTLAVSQADLVGSSIAQDQGVATVKVDISDANAEDTHTVDWSSALLIYPEASVVVIEGEGSERPYEGLEFDPVDFSVGVYTFVVVVSDGTDSVSAALNIKVLAQAPVLSEDADSDGDGISDAKEGAGDSDGDGIPDYEDNIAESNLIPSGYGDAVVASEVGSTMILGSIALGKGDNDITVTEDEIAELIGGGDADYDFPAGLLDFVLTGAEFGHSYMLIVPLSVALPEGAVYRKFSEAGGWTDFVENATNTLSSAIAVEGTCPELGSDAYALGLTEGNNCVQLVIEEGGPNDADGLVNGTLVDPGGFAVEYFGPPSELSEITLSRSQLTANGIDSATITIVASDVDGRRLDNIIVSASVDISGVSVGSFIALGNGIYTASLIAGNVAGSAAVVVVINDGEASISLISDTVTLSELVVQPPGPGSGSGGGCAVATDGSHDASLLLLLMIAGVLVARRRHQLS
jgi:MYXO-CTERM domain-containing protein